MALRILVIGTGSIGRRHADNLETLGAQVERLSWRSLKGRTFADVLESLGAFEGAVIATATDVRRQVIEPLAACGVGLYIEKPVAFRVDDLNDLERIVSPIADRCMSGFMMRYHPVIRHLADADLSDIFHAWFEIGHDVLTWRKNWSFSQSYAAQADGGGVLLDLCHELDLALTLFPGLELSTVNCLGHADYLGVDFATNLALTGNTQAQVRMDYLCDDPVRRIALRGQRRNWDIDLLSGQGGGINVSGFDRNEMFLNIMRDFLAILDGKTAANPIAPVWANACGSNRIIAQAWLRRHFAGTIQKELS